MNATDLMQMALKVVEASEKVEGFAVLSLDEKVMVYKVLAGTLEIKMAGALAMEAIKRQIESIGGGR